MIDTEALRKKVIDLAIQGKLTEQLPSDGDVETLYAQILDHKSQLIKEGKIKKDKELPDIVADEIPFDIPDNWKWVRLYEISDTNIGLTYHPENIVDEGIVVLRSINIQNGAFDYSDLVHVNCEVRENQYIRQNDILICSRNGSKNLVGKCAIYDGELGDVSFGAFMAILRTPLFKYVFYYLTTDAFRRYFSNDDTKQINQVTQDILKKAIVPLPPLDEQERIVAKLENILTEIDIIDDLQAKYSNDLAVLKSKIIDAGIQGKLTEQLPEDGDAEDLYVQILNQKSQLIKEGKIKKEKPLPDITEDEIPFEIPKNWKWVRLSRISNKITDGTHHSPVNTPSGDYMYITAKNIKPEGVVLDDVTYVSSDIHDEIYSRCNPEKDDVLLIKDGATTGVVTVNNIEFPFSLLSSVALIKCSKYVEPWYLVYAMRSSWFSKHIRKEMTGVGITRVVLRQIENFVMPLPPHDEQKRIVARIDAIMEQLN